jgi:hypothetical protein
LPGALLCRKRRSIAADASGPFISGDMLCTACGKESKNVRVCPHCFTPYPAQAAQQRQTQRVQSAGSPSGLLSARAKDAVARARAFVMRQTPVVRWSGAGILAILALWTFTGGGDELGPGVVRSEIVATPLQREEASAFIRRTRETALVDVQSDEVFVSYPAATFPVDGSGQFALAQEFARADEIVEGRRRRIFFYNPNGKLFAQADGVRGVVLTR